MENNKENNQGLKSESQQLKPLKDQERKIHHFHSTPFDIKEATGV